MATFEYKGKTIYIDGGLKKQIDKKVIPDLKRKDKDGVFIIDGRERSGKSTFSIGSLGGYVASVLNTPFDLSNVCMTPQELRRKIMECPKNSIVIYDEAHRGMGSTRSLNEINLILVDLMMEMGQKNLFVLIVIPTIFLLGRYAAVFRSNGLFHIYERKGQRGFWTFYNYKNKMRLYQKGKQHLDYNVMKFPSFRGRFYNQYAIDEQGYRNKKLISFNSKERTTRTERQIEQRNMLFEILYKDYKLTEPKFKEVLKKHKFEVPEEWVHHMIEDINKKRRENKEYYSPEYEFHNKKTKEDIAELEEDDESSGKPTEDDENTDENG